jgi:toxin CcdB
MTVARFDIYANPFPEDRTHTPYVLDVQNDHLGPIGSRVVIPLRVAKGFGPGARGLNPSLEIDGKSVVLDTAQISSVNAGLLKKVVGRADKVRVEVIDALDTLFGSY